MVERGLIFKNPLEGKPPRVTYEDRRALDHESIKKIISAISLHSSNALILKRDTAMVYLLSFTGIRLGEFISLEASDVDMKNRILRIRGETSKSKIARQIPIQDILFLHLEEYIKERNKRGYTTYHFFVSSHGDWGLTRHGLKNWVKSLIKKSGVKFHLHRFRHTFATDLAENDTNLFKVQKLLGHKDIRMTMVYVRSMKPEDLREDVNKLTLR